MDVTVRPSPVPWVALGTIVLSLPMLLASVVGIESMCLTDFKATIQWGGQAQLTAPIFLSGLLGATFLAVIARDATLFYRSDQKVRAGVWFLGVLTLMAILAVVTIPIYWRILILPGGLAGMLAVMLGPIVGVGLGAKSQMVLEPRPRAFTDVLADSIAAATLGAGILATHGPSTLAALYLLALPYRDLLLRGATRVSTEPLGDAVQSLFLGHTALPTAILVGTVMYLCVATPLWLVSRLLKG